MNGIEEVRELLSQGRNEEALAQTKRLYSHRKQDADVLMLFHEVYAALGELKRSACYACLAAHVRGEATKLLSFVEEALGQEGLTEARELAIRPVSMAPVFVRGIHGGDFVHDIYLGRNLPESADGRQGYWCGVYNDGHVQNAIGVQAEMLRREGAHIALYHNMVFDLIRAREVREATVEVAAGKASIVPLVGTEPNQKVSVREADGQDHEAILALHETKFLRLSQTTHFSLPQDAKRGFALGRSIPLGHSPKRKKLVLNILTDGLSWAEQKREGFRNIPNILRFFQKGIIFQNAFSDSEYTYPSLGTIESGMRALHNQLFHDQRMAELEPECITMSEQMARLGYYTAVVQGDGEGVYNGTMRGYERQLVNGYRDFSSVGVWRTIEQLEAFEETDQFLFLHVDEPHPYNSDVRRMEVTQTHMKLAEALKPVEQVTSVHLEHTAQNIFENKKRIAEMDRALGVLFDYITSHYREEEYVVHLYSDHGCSIYSEKPYLLSEDHSNSALMVCGAGVPALGFVDELASTTDIYKIVGRNAGYPIDGEWLDGNLPEALGGRRREYTISCSIFPGQTFKLCLRTETHEFHLETEHFTREDGTAVLEPFTAELYTRPEHELVEDASLFEWFLEKALTDPYCALEW